MKCWDKDLISNDLVGTADYHISDILNPQDPYAYHPIEATIRYKSEPSGTI